jgi:parallel beta-helix repeat protein
MPAGIANGSTLQLECGRIYAGTLDLSGKSNVTVRTAGDCGSAVLTPGQAVSGWSVYQGNIYSAAIGFDAAQVMVDGQPIERAHWPSRAQTWAKASAAGATSLSYAMPNADLTGATLLFRSADWFIGARKITAYSGNTMTLASTGNLSFEDYALSGQPDFYVEGKLWMLDEPGEWAVKDGRLYVWMPDGQSPEGRVWASPDKDGIDARNSSAVSIEGVRIFGAANGINALGATALRVANTEIVNSSENGIQNSGGRGLAVDRSTIRNTRHDAIVVRWGGGAETITNSTIDATGTLGMPTNARAAIDLLGSGAQVSGNSVTRSGYIGIRVYSNAAVKQNKVDTACLVLTDCGGIYVMSPDRQPLNTVIDGNTVVNVGGTQKLAWAIDLDGGSNAVTVSNNIIAGNANGVQINGGFNNTFSGNRFSASVQSHIQMNEDSSTPVVRNNVFRDNSFVSKNGEETYRLGSTLGSSSVAQFGSYDRNSYVSSSKIFANFNGAPLDFTQWKVNTGQDASSTFQAP